MLSFAVVPVISEIRTSPARTEGSTRRVTWSPRPSTAQPKKSKPGPRLATVAGAKVLTEVKTGSGSTETRVCTEALHLKTETLENNGGEGFDLGWKYEMGLEGEWKQSVAIDEANVTERERERVPILMCFEISFRSRHWS